MSRFQAQANQVLQRQAQSNIRARDVTIWRLKSPQQEHEADLHRL